MSPDTDQREATIGGPTTRAVELTLDPSPSQERWLRSYVESMRAVYNWAIEQAAANLQVRRDQRARGVPEEELTPALSWSREALIARWRALAAGGHGSLEAATDPASPSPAGSPDLPVPAA